MNLDFDPKKNYYDILWVEEWAWEDEIKKAYRKLAMKYHQIESTMMEYLQDVSWLKGAHISIVKE